MENMNTARSNFGGFVFNGCIYVFGGYSGSDKIEKSLEKYDPTTKKWQESKDFLQIANPLCLQEGKYVYIIGGTDGQEKQRIIYRLEPASMKLEIFGQMKNARALAQGSIKDGRLVVFGGEDNGLEIESFSLNDNSKNIYKNENLAAVDGDGIDNTGMIGANGFFFDIPSNSPKS